jgi:putative inorganic carbon (hco3(-)) transporter
VAELILRMRAAVQPGPGSRGGDLWWLLVFGGGSAVVLGWLLTVSLQAACAFVLVIMVIALYQHDRRFGIAAMFALWFVAPGLRRVFGLLTGYVGNDPLSLAPFLATGAIAVLALAQTHIPARIRGILLTTAGGFAIGLPVGLATNPSSAAFAVIAYLAGVAGAVLGLGERGPLARDSTLRRVLLYGFPPIAAYAVAQRVFGLTAWDQAWLDAVKLDFFSIGGTAPDDEVRVFSTLNGPGTLAPLLALSLLCYLTVQRARTIVVAGALLTLVALALTSVRSAWVALIAGGIAHVFASQGRSARVVFGSGAVIVAATLALSPVSQTAQGVLDRFETIDDTSDDSSSERRATFSATLPRAIAAPLGHGLGSAGEATRLGGDPTLRAPDNGYLSLIYQVGPIGFLLVIAAMVLVMRAAWAGAMARAPGQDLRVLLFAMLVLMLVQLTAGDEFYGSHGVVLWFLAGQVLAFDHRLRQRTSL